MDYEDEADMIKIDRNRKDENGNPIRPNDEWFEKAREATIVAIQEKDKHEADASIYGHPQIRTALEKLFHDKCAYCETMMTPGSDWDVEHFRPKGKVSEDAQHPGYYWLAYTWENLYPSCIHCNQHRKDKHRWDDFRQTEAKGKMNQFPLEDGSPRARSPQDDIHQERPLLLDPCNDDPEQHLGFTVIGQITHINNSKKGEKSIEVFHLKRRRLRDARRGIIKKMVIIFEKIQKHEAEDNITAIQSLNEILKEAFLKDCCQYAAVARAVVNDPDAFGL